MNSPDRKTSLSSELDQLENELVSLIHRRIKLLGNISRKRKDRKASFTDAELEKNLWKKWKDSAQSGNKMLYRQLFSQLNNLAYAQAEKSPDKPFCLYPAQRPLNINIAGPKESIETRLHTLVAAKTPGIRTIRDYPLNDIHVEFIKALNQGGAKLSWEEDTLHSQEADINLDGASIYVGEDKFNLFLMLALGAGHPSVVRFNCSAGLKNHSLREEIPLFTQLGARLNFIEPQSYSPPLRLEASGNLPESIDFPDDCDPDLLLALIIGACTYPRPLNIRFNPEKLPPQATNCLHILKQCGVTCSAAPGEIKINPGPLSLPRNQAIQLDPVLSAYLLTMPLYTGGTVLLEGDWPGCPLASSILDLLNRAGLRTEVKDKQISSSRGPEPEEADLDIRELPRLLPLAIALIAGAKKKGSIFTDNVQADVDTAGEFLEAIGVTFRIFPNRVEIGAPDKSAEKGPHWECPTPSWCLAYALVSFSYRGLCLANPGILTSVWPQFWKIFMSLPEPQKQYRRSKENNTQNTEKPQRRRIIVR
ncbi:MAG: hypothetical protein ACQES5_06605 [Thermodesulfobacteriota bacterium]